ncbi:MAG: carbohydrate ABC transporter permease [Caldilineaceae bacterium]|jgi:ABC-type glycerol-3-phosphate transport system permease component|nr:carbohydrate ABC transporter permease [Caldilineaceae bacterium]
MKNNKQLRSWVFNGVLIGICFVVFFPILSTLLLSIKEPEDVRRNPPILLPCDTESRAIDLRHCRFSLDGYSRVLLLRPNPNSFFGQSVTGRLFTQYLPNTLFYATFAALITTLLAGLAAYGLSRFRFQGRRLLLTSLLALSGVPLLTMLLALYQMNVRMRQLIPGYEERLFMVVVYVGFELPFAIWVVKGFFDTIPVELEEAAKIDGASPLSALVRIVAPLAAPGLVSIFLLTYVNVWNEFIANYLLLGRSELRGAMYGIYEYISQSLSAYNALAAACILVILPVIVIFLFTRQAFFRSMLEGAIKG